MLLHCIHMIAQLIKVGNSKGIRIPKPLIEECNLTERVNLEVKGESLVISLFVKLEKDGKTPSSV